MTQASRGAGRARSLAKETTESESKDAPAATDRDYIKLSANISQETANALAELAARKGVTKTESLRRAVATEKFIQDALASGAKILIKEGDEYRELVLL